MLDCINIRTSEVDYRLLRSRLYYFVHHSLYFWILTDIRSEDNIQDALDSGINMLPENVSNIMRYEMFFHDKPSFLFGTDRVIIV